MTPSGLGALPLRARAAVQERLKASPRYRWWVLIALLGGLFSLNFTFTAFVVDLATIAKDFHTNLSVITWVSTGPLLAFGIAAPFFGKAGDLFGYRRLYLLGLIGAMFASICTALSPDIGLLIAARCLDGIQGAATGTASMAIILTMFEPRERVKAMGWWSMIGAGGPVIGVAIGAPIITVFGWRTLFWFQLLLLVVSWACVALVLPATAGSRRRSSVVAQDVVLTDGTAPIPEEIPNRWKGMDWVGSWSMSGTVTGAMLAISIGPIVGWSSFDVVLCVAIAAVCLGIFIYRERTAANPLIPPVYFTRRNFVLPMATRACVMFAYFGGFFLFPLMMEKDYGWSVIHVGNVSIMRPFVFAVSAPIAGYLAMKIGERVSIVAGAASGLLSMILFALTGATSNLLLTFIALAAAGLGMGVAMPSSSSIQANEVDPSQFGVMGAAQQLAAQVGEVAGIQVLITVNETLVRQHHLTHAKPGPAFESTFRLPFEIGAAVAVVGVVSAVFVRSMDRSKVMPGPDPLAKADSEAVLHS